MKKEKKTEYLKPSVTATVIAYSMSSIISERFSPSECANHRLDIVLIERKKDPYAGLDALPGGFLNVGKETLEECAVRELREETNIVTVPWNMHLIGVMSNPKRDPRGVVIDVVFAVPIPSLYATTIGAGDDAASVHLWPLFSSQGFLGAPALAFDHNKSVDLFMKWIKGRVGI